MSTPASPVPPDVFPIALMGRVQAIMDACLSLVPRIVHVPAMLDAQLLHASVAGLLRALQDMHHAVGLAEPESPSALWRRTWPFRSRHSARLLRERFQDALQTQAPLAGRLQVLRALHEPQQASARHSLQRLERSRSALDPRVRQAQELLAELWDTLRPQRPGTGDQELLRQLRALLAEVDRQRVAVKRLEGVCAGAADVVRLGESVLAGRHDLLDLLGPPFATRWAHWHAQVEPLTRGDVASQDVLSGSDQALAARGALLLLVDRARIVCTRVQIDEQALAQALAHLRDQLAPFASQAACRP